MDKVVILGRVSTDKQDYKRQINESRDYCNRVGWEVVNVFVNKVSGAKSIKERIELQQVIQFIKKNKISRVVCLEISRLGRMHSDAQFAGSSSVPAHVEMMGFLGMGNNPMVGAPVAVAVAIQQAMA